MSELSSQSQSATMSPMVMRYALLFEKFMTSWTLMAFAMAITAFGQFGASGFALGGAIFFAISLGLLRLAVLVTKPLTSDDRAQLKFEEKLLYHWAGLLIPLVCMAIVLSRG